MVAAWFFVSQLVGLGVQDIKHLQYAVILVGISYGGVFGLLPTIASEWFGMGAHSRSYLLELQRLTCHFLHHRQIATRSPLLGKLGPHFLVSDLGGEHFLDDLWEGFR